MNKTLRSLRRLVARTSFPGSASYWEGRYRRNGTSGVGSYGKLAQFKADVINGFVAREGVDTVVELGCGDGAQLALAEYPQYLGLDVSRTSVERCQARFRGDPRRAFCLYPPAPDQTYDLSLSLDVVYHLVEDVVYEQYMRDLFRLSHRWVVVYSSNVDYRTSMLHVRHRRFTGWVESHRPDWAMVEQIPNRYPAGVDEDDEGSSFADFFVYRKVS